MTSGRRSRAGFSLIEVMIALTVLVLVVTMLSGLSVALSGRSVRNAGQSMATGLLTQEIDRAVAVPIESLAVRLGQTTIDTPVTTPWSFERGIAVRGRADSLTVSISIRPLQGTQRQDSLFHSVLRTR